VWGNGGIPPQFFISALGGRKWLASWPSHFSPEDRAPDWFGFRIGLDRMEERRICCPCQTSILVRSPHILSLYRLSYLTHTVLRQKIGNCRFQRNVVGYYASIPPHSPTRSFTVHTPHCTAPSSPLEERERDRTISNELLHERHIKGYILESKAAKLWIWQFSFNQCRV
jgi:hypothetical protein